MPDAAPVATPPASAPAPVASATPAPSLLADAPATTAPNTASATTPATTDAKAETSATPAVAAGEIKLMPPKDSGLTEDDTKKIAEFAKANGLTQAQAEKVMERDAAARGESSKAEKSKAEEQQKQAVAQAEKLKVEGAQKFKADPDFGGPKFDKSLQQAKNFIAKYADPELRSFLATHPLGNDPHVLRMLARAGADLAEDRTLGGSSSTPGAPRKPEIGSPEFMKRYYPSGKS